MDLALTARTLCAPEARQMGLVSDVIPTAAAGTAGAAGMPAAGSGGQQQQQQQQQPQQVAAKPGLALQGTKRALLQAR